MIGNTTTAFDEVKDFLDEKGFELVEGHFSGYSSGGMSSVPLADHMNDYEMWFVIVRKKGNPKSASVKRVVCRPTREGLKMEWADDPNQ